MVLEQLNKVNVINEFEAKELQVMQDFYLNNPDSLTRTNEIAHFTVSSWVINKNFDKVLMAYHNIYNSWAWLGGHVDGESDFINVAIKELQEESGLSDFEPLLNYPLSIEILTVKAHVKNNQVVATHLHLNVTYAFIGDESKPLKIKADENSAVAWIKFEDLDKKVTEPAMLPIIIS